MSTAEHLFCGTPPLGAPVSYLHYHVYSHIQKTGGATTFQPHFTNKAKWSIFPWSYFLLDYFRNRISAPARSKVVCSFSLPVGNHFLFVILIVKTLIHNDEKKNSTAYEAEKKMTFQRRTRSNYCCHAHTSYKRFVYSREMQKITRAN